MSRTEELRQALEARPPRRRRGLMAQLSPEWLDAIRELLSGPSPPTQMDLVAVLREKTGLPITRNILNQWWMQQRRE